MGRGASPLVFTRRRASSCAAAGVEGDESIIIGLNVIVSKAFLMTFHTLYVWYNAEMPAFTFT